MTQKIVAGNWKMHGSKASVAALLDALKSELHSADPEAILFAPFVFLPILEQMLQGSVIQYGAQTVSEHETGAYTGEVSASMLKAFACHYVLVGHSERRMLLAESNALVGKKFAKAQEYGLTPILCVGETLQQREAGQTMAIVTQQLQAVCDIVGIGAFSNAVIAYEPVWAIGTGKTATPEQAQQVHAEMRGFLAAQDENIAQQVSLLYGGSVKASNAAALATMPDINGALVGGASLEANEFIQIVNAFE